MDYQKHYTLLVERGRNKRTELGYLEKHHIVPRCLGGDNKKENIIHLTPEEHFFAHKLLLKLYPNNPKIVFALRAMTMTNRAMGRPTNKLFGWVRREWHKQISILNKDRAKPLSDDHRQKISETKKKQNLKWTEEQRLKRELVESRRALKFSEATRGKKLSEEHKLKLAVAGTGRKTSPETREKLRMKALNRTPEQRKRRYEAATTPEVIEKYRKASANKVWMIDPRTKKTSFVSKELVQEKLDNGWLRGRSI